MRIFYTLLLITGFLMAVLSQVASRGLLRGEHVARVLSSSPDSWTVELDEGLQKRLADHRPLPLKEELVAALRQVPAIPKERSTRTCKEGLALVALSIIGLIREHRVRKMKRQIEQRGGG